MSDAEIDNLMNFDHLSDLAQNDPSEFESLRLAAIESYIASLPEERQERLRRLQWRIDQERRNHSPLGACMKISNMMWDHLLGPKGLLGMLQRTQTGEGLGDQGRVIPFPATQEAR